MALHTEIREQEGIAILDLKGRLTFGEEDALFRETVQKLIAEGKSKFIVNLEHVSTIDSTGAGTLIYLLAEVKKVNGRMVLLHARLDHLETFVVLKLEAFFEIYSDEIDSINSFFPDRISRPIDVMKVIETLRPK